MLRPITRWVTCCAHRPHRHHAKPYTAPGQALSRAKPGAHTANQALYRPHQVPYKRPSQAKACPTASPPLGPKPAPYAGAPQAACTCYLLCLSQHLDAFQNLTLRPAAPRRMHSSTKLHRSTNMPGEQVKTATTLTQAAARRTACHLCGPTVSLKCLPESARTLPAKAPGSPGAHTG